MLDAASIEARSLRHDYIGTEHILLACIRENQSVAHQFFEKESLSVDEVRKAVQDATVSRDTSLVTRQRRVQGPESYNFV